MEQALSLGLVCMFAFLFLLWRNLWDSAARRSSRSRLRLVVCVGAMELLGMPFNFANVIVLPMLIGMGIDNGVHLVHRHRTNPAEVDVLGTSTARAVFFSALDDGALLRQPRLRLAPRHGGARPDADDRRRRDPRLLRGRAARGAGLGRRPARPAQGG